MVLKVHIIEDEPYIRMELMEIIEWEGYGFTIVGQSKNGKEALKSLEENSVDLIITDIEMPHMSGIEFLKNIRERGWDIEVVFLTGFSEFQYAREGAKLNIVDYLLKPIDTNQLIDVLNRVKSKVLEKQIKGNKSYNKELVSKQMIDIIQGKIKDEEIINSHIDRDYVVVANINIKDFDDEGEQWLKDGTYYIYMDKIKDKINNAFKLYMVKFIEVDLGSYICILQLKLDDGYMILEEKMKDIENEINLNESFSIEIGLGHICNKLNIRNSYFEAKKQIYNNHLRRFKNVFDFEVNNENKINNKVSYKDEIVKKSKLYVKENIEGDITLNKVSQYLNISKNYFCSMFKQETGINFLNYIVQQKIERAKKMLVEENMKVYEVSERLGYSDTTYFSKIFKRNVGVTPQDYKRGELGGT
jgi:two-component system response regulator YesN